MYILLDVCIFMYCFYFLKFVKFASLVVEVELWLLMHIVSLILDVDGSILFPRLFNNLFIVKQLD